MKWSRLAVLVGLALSLTDAPRPEASSITNPSPGTVTSITAGTGLTGGTITSSGTVALSTPVSVANGGTNATSFTSGSIPYFDGTRLAQNNANLFWDNPNTRLGIGTPAPAVKLEVVGNIRASSGGTLQANALNSADNVANIILRTGTDTRIGNSNIITAQDGGNVGIGTTAPAEKLEITGGGRFTGVSSGGSGSGVIVSYGDTANTGRITSITYGIAYRDLQVHSGVFSVSTGGSGVTEKMRIDTAGNVGIGTAGPTRILHVFGTGAVNPKIETTGAGGNSALLQFTGGALNADWVVGTNRGDIAGLDSNLFLYSNTSSGIVIQRGGNVGIGTSNPTHALTLPSTSSGLVMYSTVDQTTNYGRLRLFNNGGIMTFVTDIAGTVGSGDINLRFQVGDGSNVRFLPNQFSFNASAAGTAFTFGTGTTDGPLVLRPDVRTLAGTDANAPLTIGGFSQWAPTSGTAKYVLEQTYFNPSSGAAKLIGHALEVPINQTGTATGDYTALLVNATETAVTGTNKYLLELQTGGSTKVVVTSAGNVGIKATAPQATLDLQGSWRTITTSTSVNLSLTTAHQTILATTGAGGITLTLPAASANTVGLIYHCIKVDAGAGALTIAAAGTDTINGAASKTVSTQYAAARVVGISATAWAAQSLGAL